MRDDGHENICGNRRNLRTSQTLGVVVPGGAGNRNTTIIEFEVRLRELLDIERQPSKMLVADSLAGALPNRAELYGFEHERRFLPATKKCVGEIMYIEKKRGGALTGRARIGRVRFSKSRKTIYYDGMKLQSLKGSGGKANFYDVEFGTWYWISKCRKDGVDTLYPGEVEID